MSDTLRFGWTCAACGRAVSVQARRRDGRLDFEAVTHETEACWPDVLDRAREVVEVHANSLEVRT